MEKDQLLECLRNGEITCLLENDGKYEVAKTHGIDPLMKWYELGLLQGAVIYDRIVGKAAAVIMCYAGIKELHTFVISSSAKEVMEKSGIPFTYEEEVPYVINRKQDGMCPMEASVLEIDDLHEAYQVLCEKVKQIK